MRTKLCFLGGVGCVKMIWVVIVVRCYEQLNIIHYKSCNEIDGTEKLLILKLDNL
jgi:hypothetical protein